MCGGELIYMDEFDKEGLTSTFLTPQELDAQNYISNQKDRFEFAEAGELKAEEGFDTIGFDNEYDEEFITEDLIVNGEELESSGTDFDLIEKYAQQSCDFSDYTECHDAVLDFQDEAEVEMELSSGDSGEDVQLQQADEPDAVEIETEPVESDSSSQMAFADVLLPDEPVSVAKAEEPAKKEEPKSAVITWGNFPTSAKGNKAQKK